MKNKKINLLIAYDQQLVAEGLKAVLERERSFHVLESIPNGKSVLEYVKKLNPQIILLEFAHWPCHYLKYIKELAAIHEEMKLMIIAEKISQQLLVEVMSHVNAYLLKTCSSANVILAIEEINKKQKYICPQEIEEFLSSKNEKNPGLTSREEEILSNWLATDDNSQIALNLNISESTVRTHLKNIRQKINCSTNIQMMVYACKNNILNLGIEPICPNCKYSCRTLELNCN